MMLPDVIEILSDLIRIDSRNLYNLKYSGVRESNEEKVAAYIERLLEEMGFSLRRQYLGEGRPIVIARHFCGVPGCPVIGLTAHMDTVGTAGMTIPPFEPEIKDGLIYGRGSCDTKGSLAAMLKACEILIAEEIPADIMFVGMAAEETRCEGSRLLDLGDCDCEGFIVGEPTCNLPVAFHKSAIEFQLICRGRASHGSRPELGDNAIYKAAKLALYLENTVVPELAEHRSAEFPGGCTLSLDRIEGGKACNIVPDLCTLLCDMRLLPEMNPPEILEKIRSGAENALGFPVELENTRFANGLYTAPEHPLAGAVARAVAANGLNPELQFAPYCTDGGNLSVKGYPCIVLGPGDIKMAHGAVEYTPVAQVRQAVSVYVSAVREFVNGGGQ